MPKMKTHRGAAKRFKVTGTGKLRRLQINTKHGMEKSPPSASVASHGEVRGRPRRRRPHQADARPLGPTRPQEENRHGTGQARRPQKKHRRATLERAKGYYGNKSRSYRSANEEVMHSLQYAFRDRRARKGDFR